MGMESGVDAEVLARLLAFVEQTNDIVAVSDPWGRILYLNPAARKRLGVADTTDVTLADLIPPETFGHYYEIIRPQLLRTGSWSGDMVVNVAGTGAVPMHVSITANLGPGGETNGGVVYAHEIPRFVSPAPRDEADVDETTGLLTPSAFEQQVDLALAQAGRDGETCALVLAQVADIDGLLDYWGVEIVASVMRTLASRITGLARTIDSVGRVGEFRTWSVAARDSHSRRSVADSPHRERTLGRSTNHAPSRRSHGARRLRSRARPGERPTC